MNENPLIVPTVAFWILAPLTAVAPARWSVWLYLLLVQIDLSGLGNFSTTALGIDNVIKVVVIPTLLLLRIRKSVHLDRGISKLVAFWIFFVGYACLATIWSPFRVSAIKMIGYLYAYSVLFIVFTTAWRQKWFSVKTLIFVVWVSMMGAVIQTYFLGNAFGSDEFQWRFTTFAGAQSFAPFLLCLLVLLLFRERLSFFLFLTVLAAGIGVLLTGSRSVFLGLLWVLLIYGIFCATRSGKRIRAGPILRRTFLVGAAVAVLLLVVIDVLPENRLNEMIEAAAEKNATVEDVGTFGWRVILYQETIDELIHRNPLRLLVGSGTSTGAALVLDEGIYQEQNVDPNRALHDEFLRTIYEWGFLGLFSLLFFLSKVFKLSLTIVRDYALPEGWAFLAISGPLLLGLTFENILADSGSPGGVGYNLVLTSMVAAWSLIAQKEQILEPETISHAVSSRMLPEQ